MIRAYTQHEMLAGALKSRLTGNTLLAGLFLILLPTSIMLGSTNLLTAPKAAGATGRVRVAYEESHSEDWGWVPRPYSWLLPSDKYDVSSIRATITSVLYTFTGTVVGSNCPFVGDCATYSFDVPAGIQTLVAYADWSRSEYAAIAIYDPSGNRIQRAMRIGERTDVHVHSPVSGTYMVGIRGSDGLGYTITVGSGPDPIRSDILSNVDVLIFTECLPFIPYAPYRLPFAYSPTEINAITNFIDNGGRMFITEDYFNDGTGLPIASNSFLQSFGIQFRADMVYDPTDNVAGTTFWPVIHNFRAHPVTCACGLLNLAIYAGDSIDVTSRGYGLAWGDDDTYSSLPSVPVGNIVVMAGYENTAGGKIVALGDHFWYSDPSREKLFLSVVSWLAASPLVTNRWSQLDGVTPDASSLSGCGNSVFMAARSIDNTIWYRSYSANVWGNWVQVGGYTDARPTVQVFNSSLYMVGKQASSNNLWYGYYPLSGDVVSGPFSGWKLMDGPSPYAVSLASDGSYLYVAAVSVDGSIWHRRVSTSGSWTSWFQVSGFSDVAPAIAVFQNRLYIVCKQRGSTNLWYGYVDLTAYPSGWSGWTFLPGPSPDAAQLTVSSSRLYVSARSTDNTIWYASMGSSEPWSNWIQLPGYTSSAIGICVYSGSLVFAAREAGATRLWWYGTTAT